MRSVGLRPVVVHGGGPQISDLMERLGKVPEFRDGQRVTDAETVDIARMVLVGKVNREIVGAINVHGPARRRRVRRGRRPHRGRAPATPSSGSSATSTSVHPAILERLLAEDLIPVVSTIGADETGQAYNINADAVAGAIAEALAAEKVIYLTDIEGLLADVADAASLISRIDARRPAGAASTTARSPAGMIPKIAACLHAVGNGVGSAHLLDGRVPHVVLLELFSDAGIGTMITGGGRRRMSAVPRQPPHADLRAAARSQLVRGEGTLGLGRPGPQATSTSCPASRSRASATATRRWPTRSPSRPARCCTCRTCSAPQPGPQVARTLDRLLGVGQPGWPAEGTRGQVFFCNSGGRGQRVRPQARPEVRRPGPARRRERVRLLPRPHARHAPRHRPAGQARGVPAAARGLPPRRLGRPRRPRARARPVRRRGAARARAGRGRRQPGDGGVLPGRPAALRRAGDPVHGRRGADRPRPVRQLVRAPAARRRARRRHDGQGARQRRADRRLLGQGRGGRRVRARRPRHDLRRPAAGHRRGPGRARRDGGRGRARPGGAGRRPAHARRSQPLDGVAVGAGPAACSSASSSTAATPRRSPRACSSAARSSTPSRPTALRLAPSLLDHRRRDRPRRRPPREGAAHDAGTSSRSTT